ncbi:MAG: phosphoribosyltransferase [Planctomycetes bacterium]|nr:phosphoribosyltransferase [Planctomycetota bacterium]
MSWDPPLEDRADAGRRLARALAGYAGRRPLVLAIPRGAVPMGLQVAEALGGDLDVALVRKLGAPGNPELAIGAVSEDGAVLLHPQARVVADDAWIAAEVERQRALLRARRAAWALRPPVDPRRRVVIVVDDGVATGATMAAALEAVRRRGPAELVAAAAVAPPDVVERLARVADRVVVLRTPPVFRSVGEHFRDFSQVTDDEVARALARAVTGHAPGTRPLPSR